MDALTSAGRGAGIRSNRMWRFAILFLLTGCELRGLTRSQLYGPEPDAGAADAIAPAPDAIVADAVPARDAAAVDLAPDLPPPPPEGIIVTGFIGGTCHNEQVMVGGAGFHTCSYSGKGSYRLRIRNISPGTRIEIGARLPGYLPDPATAVITLEATGTVQNFQLSPASGSCDTVVDPGPCICLPEMGCEPS
jgi:hypothetical protein